MRKTETEYVEYFLLIGFYLWFTATNLKYAHSLFSVRCTLTYIVIARFQNTDGRI